jgi:hypothetical protein
MECGARDTVARQRKPLDLSRQPLVIFAQKRQATLDTEASIIPTLQADRVHDVTDSKNLLSRMLVAFKTSVLWLQARVSICSFLPVGNTGAMPSLLLVTKYGL